MLLFYLIIHISLIFIVYKNLLMDKTNAKQIKSLIIITRGIITRKSFPHPWKFIDYTSTLGVGNFL